MELWLALVMKRVLGRSCWLESAGVAGSVELPVIMYKLH